MRDFVPAKDYPNLLKQANALNRLLNTNEVYLSQLKQQYGVLLNEISLLRINEVNSLRDENEILTNLLENNGKRI